MDFAADSNKETDPEQNLANNLDTTNKTQEDDLLDGNLIVIYREKINKLDGNNDNQNDLPSPKNKNNRPSEDASYSGNTAPPFH